MPAHHCVPPFVPLSLSAHVERNSAVRVPKLLTLWGFLLSARTPMSVDDLREAISASVRLSSAQSFHLYLRVMADLELAVPLDAPAGARRRSFAGSFPSTLPEPDRRILGEWIDNFVCPQCISTIRARFLGGCPVRGADQRSLPPLPEHTSSELHAVEGLYQPKVRSLWGHLITTDGGLTKAAVTEWSTRELGIRSTQTIGHYLRSMTRANLIEVTTYLPSTGKVYQGRIPAHTTQRDLSALEPWLATLPANQAEIVSRRLVEPTTTATVTT